MNSKVIRGRKLVVDGVVVGRADRSGRVTWGELIKQLVAGHKTRLEAGNERERREKLREERAHKADDAFESYDFEEKEGVTVEDHEGWETDGEDRLTKKLFFVPLDALVDNSEVGSFIVDFKAGKASVADCHFNG